MYAQLYGRMESRMVNNLSLDQIEVLNQVKSTISEMKKVIIGKDEIIIKVLLSVLAKGHILIEDIPGVGKTTLALALSKAMSLQYQRLQFTPDVLPTDVTGFNIMNKDTGKFDYKPGAAMCNLFLADEINRTSSKTQSALLEVMEEGKVTVDGISREVPQPYIVIATQNPIGSIGTQMLPESQLDRFMIRLTMGYPDIESEIDIIKSKQACNPLLLVNETVSDHDITKMQCIVEKIFIDDKVYKYIANLIFATRNHDSIKVGVSPRGTLALTSMSKATALLRGRDYVIPDDVKYIFSDVASHRIILSSKARINGITTESIFNNIFEKVQMPKMN